MSNQTVGLHQRDKSIVASAIREHWATLHASRPATILQQQRMEGARRMADVICRTVGLDPRQLEDEGQRLALQRAQVHPIALRRPR